jgi:deltex-like protein
VPGPKPEAAASTKLSKDEKCSICSCPFTNKKTLDKCGHSFCTKCIEKAFKVKRQCPTCNQAYGPLICNQPEGEMIYSTAFSDFIIITYKFPDGIQRPDHPNPGKPYKGKSVKAYLPNNGEGNEVLRLLMKAFDKKLTFTIGRSSTGMEDVVMFTDIPHNTLG